MANQNLTKGFFLYNFSGVGSGASMLVRTDRELSKDELLPFRKAVMEVVQWVEDAFSVSRYFDEDRLRKVIKGWKDPDPVYGIQDVEGNILKPFDDTDHIFNDKRWRVVFSFATV